MADAGPGRFVPSGVTLCKRHGNALCPQDYMLKEDGTPKDDYKSVWKESLRCPDELKTILYKRVIDHD